MCLNKVISLSLSFHCDGKPINRLKLLLYATFNFVNAVFVQSNYICAQYKIEQ